MAEAGGWAGVRRAGWVATVTAAVALVAGSAEALVHGIRSGILEQFTWTSREIGWMAPLSYLAFLLVAAAPIAALAAFRPWKLVPVAAGLSGTMAAFALVRLLTLQRLHVVAMAVIAVAVGYQLGRLVARSPERTNRIAGRVVAGLGLVLSLLGLGQWAAGRISESRGIAKLPAAPAGAPNVLLLVLDTVRGDHLGTYGYSRPTTPWIDGFATRGTVFEYAISAAPWTLPSHATMFTARQPWEHRATFRQPLAGGFPTLAEYFRDRGYLTAGFVGNSLYAHHESGLNRGFSRYRDYPVSLRQILLSSEIGQLISSRRSNLLVRQADRPIAPTINRWFLDWLDSDREEGRPFFVFLNYMDAHVPYRTPPEWRAKFSSGVWAVDAYDSALGYLDDQLGRLFESLDARGALRNTVVVITSDHGEHLGDHGLQSHANSLYLGLLRVPLIIVDSRATLGSIRSRHPVGLVDLAPTLIDLAGLRSLTSAFPGTPFRLQTRWSAGAESARPIISQVDQNPLGRLARSRNLTGAMWSIVEGGTHLIENPDQTVELFDMFADPGEVVNLSTAPGRQLLISRLRAGLQAARSKR